VTLREFNAADSAAAQSALLLCCGSTEWTKNMLHQRPFSDLETLLSNAESSWWTLAPADWLEAFSAHPKIGETRLSCWCSQEQSGVRSAGGEILERLAAGNRNYQQRFGWIFLVNASGKNASEMLEVLHSRLTNESAEELRIAAGEQAQITRLRLRKLFEL
jgi:2-oxo-4-hydroxy-4-carboxy-5-ureidoimidazoline decarboxylase